LCQHDLSSFEVEYVFLDAIYESLRVQAGLKEALLAAWAICRNGRKVLLHMQLGNKESLPAWRHFLRDMVKRGLPTPTLVTTDGAPALLAAVEEIWPKSLRQRCLAHKKRNVLDKVPDSARQEVKRAVSAVYDAPNREVADLLGSDFVERYSHLHPSAVTCFQDDLDACLAFLSCPAVHHSRIRTTNLLERAFVEERRRTKTIPRFFNERSCLKLVFATLWQASQRWHNLRHPLAGQPAVAQRPYVRSRMSTTQPPATPTWLRQRTTEKRHSICRRGRMTYLTPLLLQHFSDLTHPLLRW